MIEPDTAAVAPAQTSAEAGESAWGSLLDAAERGRWLRTARRSAGWSRQRLATELHVSLTAVAQWEAPSQRRGPNVKRLLAVSAKLGVPLPESWRADAEVQRELKLASSSPLRRRRPPPQAPAATVSAEIVEVARVLSHLAGTGTNAERNAAIFAQRYGAMGSDVSTLQACGDRHGMTRERARQICDRMLERATAFVVRLDRSASTRLSEAVRRCSTMPLDAAEVSLREHLGDHLGLQDARRFANEVLGMKLPFVLLPVRVQIPGPPEGLLFVPGDLPTWIESAVSHAKRLIGHTGAAHVSLVYALVVQDVGAYIDPVDFKRTIASMPRFQWLDAESWFWFGPDGSYNRMVERTIELLAVAGRHVDVEVIHAGLARNTNVRDSAVAGDAGVLAPIPVIRALLAASPQFAVKQRDDFALADPVSADSLLSPSALAIYRFMHARGNVAARSELSAAFVRTGVLNPVTMSVTLAIHPALRHLDRGLFALRGRPLDLKRLAEAAAIVGMSPGQEGTPAARLSASLDDDGSVAFDFVLTEGALRNRMTTLPVAVRSLIPPGAYALDGGRTLRVSAQRSDYIRGVVKAICELGASPGDVWRVRLWPGEHRAELTPAGREGSDPAIPGDPSR